MFTDYGPKFACFWLSEGFKMYYFKLLDSLQKPWKSFCESNLKLQDTNQSKLPDTFHVESSINKLSSHCSHRLCFRPIIHWTGHIYQLSGSGHNVRISLARFCVSFLSHWYIPVWLSKHCPYRLLSGLLCKAIAKFSSRSVSRKKSVRSLSDSTRWWYHECQMQLLWLVRKPPRLFTQVTSGKVAHACIVDPPVQRTRTVSIFRIQDRGEFGTCFSSEVHAVWEYIIADTTTRSSTASTTPTTAITARSINSVIIISLECHSFRFKPTMTSRLENLS